MNQKKSIFLVLAFLFITFPVVDHTSAATYTNIKTEGYLGVASSDGDKIQTGAGQGAKPNHHTPIRSSQPKSRRLLPSLGEWSHLGLAIYGMLLTLLGVALLALRMDNNKQES